MKKNLKFFTIFFCGILCTLFSSLFAENLEKGKALYDQKHFVQAFPVIEKEAKEGNPEAQFLLGKMYDLGQGRKKNLKKAVHWYSKGAHSGNSKAMYNLAIMYSNGEGVHKNLNKAFDLYTKAAIRGNSDAQFNLALIYLNGEGVQQNYQKSFEWFQKAALQGDKIAQYNVGLMYNRGKGVKQNYSNAIYWYQKSAAQNYASAEYALGLIYQRGRGVHINLDEAAKWYKKAAEQGHTPSMFNLASLYLPEDNPGDAKRWDEVYKWYEMGIQHGDKKDAPFGMGLIYVMGWGNYPKDYPKASQLFTLAAENGKADGWYWLGVMEENGFGRPVDKDKAFELYRKAASLGSDPAIRRLNRETSGTGVVQSLKELISPLQ